MTTTSRLAAIVCVLLALTLTLSAQVQKSEREGIRNFSRVDATVGCGGATDPAALVGLRKDGFVSVINLRLATEEGANVDAEGVAAKAAGLKYIHLPFNAAAPDAAVVDKFLAAVADKSNQPVFIHCGSANRVGGVWMIKAVHMVPAPAGSNVEWASFWASLTFEAPAANAGVN